MNNDSALHVGTIVGAHGIKGYLKLYASAESAGLFKPGKRLSLHRREGKGILCTVRDFQPYAKGYLIAFEGITDRDAAEKLMGFKILIQRSELPPIEKDCWYWCDLIGVDVYQSDNAYIGRIEKIFSTGANDVFVVKNRGNETLIPAIESVIRNIDLAEKKITVDLPDGL